MIIIRIRSFRGTSRVEFAEPVTVLDVQMKAAELLDIPLEDVALSLHFAPDAPRLAPDDHLAHGALVYVSSVSGYVIDNNFSYFYFSII